MFIVFDFAHRDLMKRVEPMPGRTLKYCDAGALQGTFLGSVGEEISSLLEVFCIVLLFSVFSLFIIGLKC